MIILIIRATIKRKKDILKVVNRFKSNHKDLFIKCEEVFIMKDNGVAWCYASSLKKKFPDEVTLIYGSSELWFTDLPKIFQEGGEWLAEKSRKLEHLPKALGLTEEELKSVKLEDVKTFFKIKGKKENQVTLDKIKEKFK